MEYACVTHKELLERPNGQHRDLIPGVVPYGALVGLYGGPKAGKTFLAQQLAYSVATGRDWLGRTVDLQGTVLYFALDTNLHELATRTDQIARTIGDLIDPPVVYFDLAPGTNNPTRLHVEWSDDYQRLKDTVHRYRPVLVIYDVLALTHTKNGNDYGEMYDLMNHLHHASLGATTLVVHHTAKEPRDPRFLSQDVNQAGLGSQAITGSTHVNMRLKVTYNGDDDRPRTGVLDISGRIPHVDPIHLEQHKDGPWYVVDARAVGRPPAVKERGLIDAVLFIQAHKDLGHNECEQAAIEAGFSRSTFKRAWGAVGSKVQIPS